MNLSTNTHLPGQTEKGREKSPSALRDVQEPAGLIKHSVVVC